MMLDRLAALERRFDEIEGLLADPEISADYSRVQALLKEQASMRNLVALSREYRSILGQIEDARAMLRESDHEMTSLAREELSQLEPRLEQLEKELDPYAAMRRPTRTIDWKKVGSLRLAASPDRMMEARRLATMARRFGLEMQVISPQEAFDLFPLIDTKGLKGAAFIPTDGYVDPASLCQAIAKGARMGGVEIRQGVKVLDFRSLGRRVTGVMTSDGSSGASPVLGAPVAVLGSSTT